MKNKVFQNKRLKRLNVLQDIRDLRQRLTSCSSYQMVSAKIRRKTLDISKSPESSYKRFIYIYTISLNINVLNVLKYLYRVIAMTSASRFSKNSNVSNVLNVLSWN